MNYYVSLIVIEQLVLSVALEGSLKEDYLDQVGLSACERGLPSLLSAAGRLKQHGLGPELSEWRQPAKNKVEHKSAGRMVSHSFFSAFDYGCSGFTFLS